MGIIMAFFSFSLFPINFVKILEYHDFYICIHTNMKITFLKKQIESEQIFHVIKIALPVFGIFQDILSPEDICISYKQIKTC